MSLYLTRHGQTDWNKNQLIQGRIDVPLNEVGLAEAKALALTLKDVRLDKIISSPLQRALNTAKAVNEYHHLEIEIDNRLLEQFYGDLEGTPRSGPIYLHKRQSIAARYPNGEGYFDVVHRIYSLLDEIKAKYRDKNVLLVAHGGISRVIRSYFQGFENEDFATFGIPNCGLLKFEFVDRDFPTIVPQAKTE